MEGEWVLTEDNVRHLDIDDGEPGDAQHHMLCGLLTSVRKGASGEVGDAPACPTCVNLQVDADESNVTGKDPVDAILFELQSRQHSAQRRQQAKQEGSEDYLQDQVVIDELSDLATWILRDPVDAILFELGSRQEKAAQQRQEAEQEGSEDHLQDQVVIDELSDLAAWILRYVVRGGRRSEAE